MCFVEKKLNEIKNYNPLQKEVSSFSLKSVKQKHPRVARASLSSTLHIREVTSHARYCLARKDSNGIEDYS